MLVSTKALRDYSLMAIDGEIGRCKDFLFDDQEWLVRHMVADTGLWRPKERVLISPIALGSIDWATRHINVRLSMAEIENAPSLGEDAPDSSQQKRSMKDVIGYRIRAVDGEFGHVEDFIVDDSDWQVAYIVIDTKNWFPSTDVIIPPEWISAVDWEDEVVKLPFTKSQIKNAPEYDPHAPVNRVYETRLYDYYGRPYYR